MQGLISELGLGLRVQKWFSQNKYRLAFEVAYEIQLWDGVLMAIIKSDGPDFRDFSYKGLTISSRFDF